MVSMDRWKCLADNVSGTSTAGSGGAGAISARSTTGPPAFSHSRKRCRASSSVTDRGSHLSRMMLSPGLRSRNNRDRPPSGSSFEGAHQATTWAWALVSATYISRLSSLAVSLRPSTSTAAKSGVSAPPT